MIPAAASRYPPIPSEGPSRFFVRLETPRKFGGSKFDGDRRALDGSAEGSWWGWIEAAHARPVGAFEIPRNYRARCSLNSQCRAWERTWNSAAEVPEFDPTSAPRWQDTPANRGTSADFKSKHAWIVCLPFSRSGKVEITPSMVRPVYLRFFLSLTALTAVLSAQRRRSDVVTLSEY
ncbi:hypothetical protein KM043_012775 [Ampulex compressa]|nr:hypothetical protein KM043_012775 [Ampulex compressa]